MAKSIRGEVIAFNRKVVDPVTGNDLGELDIETTHAIVEVTHQTGAKPKQINRLLNPAVNPKAKPVILYAPRYTRAAERHLRSQGYFDRGLAAVARSPQELRQMLQSLRPGN